MVGIGDSIMKRREFIDLICGAAVSRLAARATVMTVVVARCVKSPAFVNGEAH